MTGWWRALRSLFSRADRELDAEVRGFVQQLTDELIARGVAPDEARRQALIEVGGVEPLKESVRDARRLGFLDTLRQDAGFGLRLLRRSPGFTIAAIVVLALGIGATAATFSVVDAVLLRPLAYANSEQLVVVLHQRVNPVAPANYFDWQRQASSFSEMGAAEYWTTSLGAEGADREKIYALRVTPEILPMLGVAPARGRMLRAGDDAQQEAVIADSLWRRQFGADPAIIGRAIALDNRPFTVVGVMPPSFQFAPFWATRAELWAPLPLASRAASRDGESLRVFARLKNGTTLTQARSEITAITASLERQFPGTNRDVAVTPLKELAVGDVEPSLLMLFGAVGLVLTIACANVAHMLLSRAAAREREVAVRIALGAGRRRLIRQFFTESALLSLAGGGLGVLVAQQALALTIALAGRSVPRLEGATLDLRVLLFALGVSLVSALLFGLVPAMRLSQPNLVATLRTAERGSTEGRRGHRLRQALIVSEVALAVMLLVGAVLMLRSFAALRAVDPGWVPDRVVALVVTVTGTAESPEGRRVAFYDSAIDRVRAVSGVESASAINHRPLGGDIWGWPYFVEGRPVPRRGDVPTATYRVVYPGYFETMGLPILHGRAISAADRADAPGVAVINQYFAAKQWPGEDAVGKRLRLSGYAGDAWLTVVGVSKNAVRSDWTAPPGEEIYLAFHQNTSLRSNPGAHASYLTMVVRAAGDPLALVPSIRAEIRALAPDVTVSEVTAMRDVVTEATNGTRFLLVLLTAFAGVAVVLAAVGIYGVMSYIVLGRLHEMKIRIALGATPPQVRRLVLGQGLRVAAIGLGFGVGGAMLLARVSSSVFYAPVSDPVTFIAVPVILGAVAFIASYLPARKATS
jgi:predicted permease